MKITKQHLITITISSVLVIISWITTRTIGIPFSPITIIGGIILVGLGAFQGNSHQGMGLNGIGNPETMDTEITTKHYHVEPNNNAGYKQEVRGFDFLAVGTLVLVVGIITTFI